MHRLWGYKNLGNSLFWVPLQRHPAQADLLLDLPIKLLTYLFLYIHYLRLPCGKPNIPEQLCSYTPSIWSILWMLQPDHLLPGIVGVDHHPDCPTHPAWDSCSTALQYSLLATVFFKQPGCSTPACHSFSALTVTHIQRRWLQILRCQGSRYFLHEVAN